jgi:hypothetical protein
VDFVSHTGSQLPERRKSLFVREPDRLVEVSDRLDDRHAVLITTGYGDGRCIDFHVSFQPGRRLELLHASHGFTVFGDDAERAIDERRLAGFGTLMAHGEAWPADVVADRAFGQFAKCAVGLDHAVVCTDDADTVRNAVDHGLKEILVLLFGLYAGIQVFRHAVERIAQLR